MGDSPNEALFKKVETRPLMQLFHRLISNDSKRNTVLTNAQIVSILKIEYNIDTKTLHELEADIYLEIVKKFLKNWPEWDNFDLCINQIQKIKKKPNTSLPQSLENYYMNLKCYLEAHLDATKPLAKEAVKKMDAEIAAKRDQVDTSDVTLKIHCTRKQLNKLIFDCPQSENENNIFHVADIASNNILVNSLPMESILNWWGVQVSIEMKSMSLTWSTKHQLQHVLVNKNNGPRDLKKILNENLQIKDRNMSKETTIPKTNIYTLFDAILQEYEHEDNVIIMVKALFDTIKTDLESVCEDVINVPGLYRRHTNKYPYFRKLGKKTNAQPGPSRRRYRLYMEETLSPLHVFSIGKVGTGPPALPTNKSWLTVECTYCEIKFSGADLDMLMKDHFDMQHSDEPDWICTNCQQTFPMLMLAKNTWHHICDTPS